MEVSGGALRCATCDAVLVPDASYCEACGAHVGTRDPDDARSELNLGPAAAVSDRGRVSRRNDDAFFLATPGDAVVAIVCDGVSTSASADVAARKAADTMGAALVDALRAGTLAPDAAILHAITATQDAVGEITSTTGSALADPASTLVSAVVRDGELVVAWLGDSRAYWITPGAPRQLTVDDSWARHQIATGALGIEQAVADPRARSITRWVGADAPDHPPQIVSTRPGERGLLVLCSDGLWDYVSSAHDIARLVHRLPRAASPLAIARSLVDDAIGRGGRDNVTVAVVDVEPEPWRSVAGDR